MRGVEARSQATLGTWSRPYNTHESHFASSSSTQRLPYYQGAKVSYESSATHAEMHSSTLPKTFMIPTTKYPSEPKVRGSSILNSGFCSKPPQPERRTLRVDSNGISWYLSHMYLLSPLQLGCFALYHNCQRRSFFRIP